MNEQQNYRQAVTYIRAKIDQLLTLMGTLPLRPEELDDATLLELDPIGIIADSFSQVIQHLNATNRELSIAQNEIRAILDSLGAAVIVINKDNLIEDCNRLALEWFFQNAEYEAILGQPLRSVCEACGTTSAALINSEVREHALEINGHCYQVITSDILDEQGNKEKFVFLSFDVTRQKVNEASLQLYAKIFNQTAEGIIVTDANGRIIEVNDAACRISGYTSTELLGQSPRLLQSGLHDYSFYEAMWQTIRERGYWQGETFDRLKGGEVVPLLETISEVRDGDGNITNHICVITDITALKETESRLDFLAHHDALTKLPNRLLFNDRLNQAIARASRERSLFAMLFVDLDRFKTINDSLGHHEGDRFLVEVANRLCAMLRKADTVARLGGDEFVIIVERISTVADATRLAEKIIHGLKQPITLNGRQLHIGCSIGVTLYPEDGEDATALLKNADAAMYQAKDRGRDGYCKYSRELSEAAHEQLVLENALRVAVNERQLQFHYQPIIDLKQGRVVAAEALLRWPTAGGWVSPDRFISIAEESKLIVPIGEQMLILAFTQFRTWINEGLDLDYISINVSVSQLFASGFIDHLLATFQASGLQGDQVQIELTEHALMRDIHGCKALLNRLRSHGIRIAIDDFGTGYSSLAYLKDLPIDTLKLDRSFVSDISADGNEGVIPRAVIGLAAALGLDTVAEGVETASQERYLADISCHLVQGFYYSRAVPGEQFAALAAAYSAQRKRQDSH